MYLFLLAKDICQGTQHLLRNFFSGPTFSGGGLSLQGKPDHYLLKSLFMTHGQALSGPDGSRHSSNQHPKDVNSENSNHCPIFVQEFCPPEGKLPRCGISQFLQCLNFCPTSRETPEPPGMEIQSFCLFVFCGHYLLRASLKAPALTLKPSGQSADL